MQGDPLIWNITWILVYAKNLFNMCTLHKTMKLKNLILLLKHTNCSEFLNILVKMFDMFDAYLSILRSVVHLIHFPCHPLCISGKHTFSLSSSGPSLIKKKLADCLAITIQLNLALKINKASNC
ncbi:hypothetical protein RND71_018646 [Anisodus tanguticus]|uniref:Uncharacterized protein n=1 Tax=Anisodus tanguticus TaxID=243964 RepID=A0AAE1S4L3_9SOLA|nr:hypothetical protein RND71_018646 [Anisodus tanguticus]